MVPPHISHYRIGIICALPKELAAVVAVLDEEYTEVESGDNDSNAYTLGRIHQHNVVIAPLPSGDHGENPAAIVATNMARTFKNVRLGLMVGIGGGIPSLPETDIRLGDVVISQPNGVWPGVVQYDMGKHTGTGEFERTGSLNQPPTSLLTALSSLQAKRYGSAGQLSKYMNEATERNPTLSNNGFRFPSTARDRLNCSYCNLWQPRWWQLWLFLYWLYLRWRCGECINGHVPRESRRDEDPVLHYGTIASGNSVIKNAIIRDQLKTKYNAKCVEMEAAGLMRNFPCIVIRGICDYADTYKAKDWQEYAALVAAACAKELLFYVAPEKVEGEKQLGEVLGILEKQLDVSKSLFEQNKQQNKKLDTRYDTERDRQCHRSFKTSTYEDFKNINPERSPGTCKWALADQTFCRWNDNTKNDLIWISAHPGCGKSVLARSLIDGELQNDEDMVCYFFFKDNRLQDRLSTALCAVLHQLFALCPRLIQYALSAFDKNKDLTNEVDELWRILLTAVDSSPELSVVCVFDALDECRDIDRSRFIRLLTRFYERSCGDSSSTGTEHGRLKFLVTSRPYSDIQEDFNLPRHLPSIRLRGEDENDQIRDEINIVIKARVSEMANRLGLDDKLRNQTESRLLGMEHRTYLWLYLSFESIKEVFRDNLKPNIESIENVPVSVEDAYEKILSKVSQHSEKRKQVFRVLQIVVGAKRPLTISEMAIALGIAISQRITTMDEMKLDENDLQARIRQLCGLFICFSNSRIFLIHQTAKEFLICKQDYVKTQQHTWNSCLEPKEIETEMARICVEFLLVVDIGEVRKAIGERMSKLLIHRSRDVLDETCSHGLSEKDGLARFTVYSVEHWAEHLRNGPSFTEQWLSARVLKLYETNSNHFKQWFSIKYDITGQHADTPERTNAFCEAAKNGHGEVMRLLLDDKNVASDHNSDSLGVAAAIASSYNYDMIVSLLLDGGANINGQYRGKSGLESASRRGHYKVVKLLLDRGVDINVEDSGGRNALHWASRGGHYKVVELLLDRGADIDFQGSGGRNALGWASFRGYYEVVKLLIDRGANIEFSDPGGDSALHIASSRGQYGVVELLLERGADVNVQYLHGGSALHRTSTTYGLFDLVKISTLLLDRGADIDAQNKRGETVLYQASDYNNYKLVELLLDRGANMFTRNFKGRSALEIATKKGHNDIVALLQSRGASDESLDT